ncbi:MAG: hypothetical protein JWM59_255 [Verrucomicrobiales bacterium]|nr:hypothetical protein [Verrucomicrobiales bacterium]
MNITPEKNENPPAGINWSVVRERRTFMVDVRRSAPDATDEAITQAFEACRAVHSSSENRGLLLACTLRRLLPST